MQICLSGRQALPVQHSGWKSTQYFMYEMHDCIDSGWWISEVKQISASALSICFSYAAELAFCLFNFHVRADVFISTGLL